MIAENEPVDAQRHAHRRHQHDQHHVDIVQPAKPDMLIECLTGKQRVGFVEDEVVQSIDADAVEQANDRSARIDVAEHQACNESRKDRHRRQSVQLLQEIDDAPGIFERGNQCNRGDRQDHRNNRGKPPMVLHLAHELVVKVDRVERNRAIEE